jgi:hypothetical protein
MQRLSVVLHDTVGLYLRDALHAGGATVVTCKVAPRA